MSPEFAAALVALLGTLLGGGSVTAYFRTQAGKQRDRAIAENSHNISQQEANEQNMLSFYALWNEELARLRREIDKLHALVGALEGEIVALGGDPVRVRLGLAKKLAEEETI